MTPLVYEPAAHRGVILCCSTVSLDWGSYSFFPSLILDTALVSTPRSLRRFLSLKFCNQNFVRVLISWHNTGSAHLLFLYSVAWILLVWSVQISLRSFSLLNSLEWSVCSSLWIQISSVVCSDFGSIISVHMAKLWRRWVNSIKIDLR
jgi:hypothetical protein